MKQESSKRIQEYASLFQQGDEEGLRFFYLQFYPALTIFANKWVNNLPIAEEIAADAFVNTWKMHWKLDSYGSIRAYLYTVVRRASQKALCREKKRAAIHSTVQTAGFTSDTPYDHTIRAEVYRLIHSSLQDIPPASRKVLIMHYLEGKSTGQIARELKRSPSTIKTQKINGLTALRKKIQPPLNILFLILLEIFFHFA